MEYLNTDEVAAHLRLTRRTIYHLIKSGQLIAFQSQKRGRLRFTKLQLDEYAKKMM
jgi:excisionase family DNA binding protein